MEWPSSTEPEPVRLNEQIRRQQLISCCEALLSQQLRASEERQRLLGLTDPLRECHVAILETLADFTPTQLTLQLRSGLDNAWQTFRQHILLMAHTDLTLGAAEDDLRKRLKSVTTMVDETIKTGEMRNVGDEQILGSDDAAIWDTSDDNENCHPLLSQYLKSTAAVTSITDQLSDARIELDEVIDRRDFFEDQDRPLPITDTESIRESEPFIADLEQDLIKAQQERDYFAAECTKHGIDVEQERWRNTRTAIKNKSKNLSNSSDHPVRPSADLGRDIGVRPAAGARNEPVVGYVADMETSEQTNALGCPTMEVSAFGGRERHPAESSPTPSEASTLVNLGSLRLDGTCRSLDTNPKSSETAEGPAHIDRNPPIIWMFHPHFQLHYHYDDRFDHLVYENGTRTLRPPDVSKNHLLAIIGSALSTEYDHQLEIKTRADEACSPNLPRTVPIYPAASSEEYNSACHLVIPSNSSSSAAMSSVEARMSIDASQPVHVSKPLLNESLPAAASFVIANQMKAESERAAGKRASYQVPAVRTLQTPLANTTSVYRASTAMLQSVPAPSEVVKDSEAKLYTSFKRKVKTKRFFVVGKVFLTLWTEPAGDVGSNHTAVTSGVSFGAFGEAIYSKIRRFVVVRAGEYTCNALPVLTYNHQGVGRTGVKKCEHAIIYTGKTPPEPHRSERARRGEDGLLLPIRVDPDDAAEKLDPWSRVDFGKVYSIEHNVKVRSLGKVNQASMKLLLYQFRRVWEDNFKVSDTHSLGKSPAETSKEMARLADPSPTEETVKA